MQAMSARHRGILRHRPPRTSHSPAARPHGKGYSLD